MGLRKRLGIEAFDPLPFNRFAASRGRAMALVVGANDEPFRPDRFAPEQPILSRWLRASGTWG